MEKKTHEISDLILAANARIKSGRFEEALEKTSKILAIAPKDYLGLTLHAKALRRLGRTEDSLKFFSEAFNAHLLRLDDLHQFAIALLRSDQLKDAEKHFRLVQEKAEVYLNEAREFGNYARFILEDRKIAEVKVDGDVLYFHVYPGRENHGEGIVHANGKLRELEELRFIRQKVAPNGVIVDVGANIGNHLIYFAKFLKPQLLVPIEPSGEAVRQLRENIALNKIDCVDDRYLGMGAGDKRQKAALKKTTELVTYALVPSAAGELEVFPLDDLIKSPVHFIKIDVEGMELDVLRGAKKLLSRWKPQVMIEVADNNAERFGRLLNEIEYSVEHHFPGAGYQNYFIVPRA